MSIHRATAKGVLMCTIVAMMNLVDSTTAQAQYPFARPLWGPASVEVRPGGYVPVPGTAGRVGHNPVTGSTYIPGQAVIKPSGVYRPVAPGVYKNPWTGNAYIPSNGVYIRRW